MLTTTQFRTSCLSVSPVKTLRLKYMKIYFCYFVFWLETWFLTLMEEYRLRVSEKEVLRRTVGPKREEVTGG
jgi:hypothetical protein